VTLDVREVTVGNCARRGDSSRLGYDPRRGLTRGRLSMNSSPPDTWLTTRTWAAARNPQLQLTRKRSDESQSRRVGNY